MDKQAYLHRRKKRYMAQALEIFDRDAGPLLPPDVAETVKGIFRSKMHALTLDACEVIALKPDEEINGHIIELRDHLHIEGRPIQRSTTT